MIEIPVSEDVIKEATRKAQEMGKLNNSITEGLGNVAGFIGEIVVGKYLNATMQNTYDYDLILGRLHIDVKTKRCTSPPKKYYDCSVADFNTKQQCDYYVFARVLYKNDKWGNAWLLGYYPKQEYIKKARFLKAGQTDGDNGFIVKADCYNMRIQDLHSIENFAFEAIFS